MRGALPRPLLARELHPLAWWTWALGLAVAASRTSNPLLLLLVVAVAATVVDARRSDAPWARAFRLYLLAAACIVVLRIAFRIAFGGTGAGDILLHLPEVPLPDVTGGLHLFGDVATGSLLAGAADGLRLGTIVVCFGAANALANPRRLLATLPPALADVGTALVVAISVFPQLAESVRRVRRARRLRGMDHGSRRRRLQSVVVPVLEDALERSIALAASMDSRGFGHAHGTSARERRATAALAITGLLGVCIGAWATLDATTPRILATPVLLTGTSLAIGGLVLAGRGAPRTRYRPDRWRAPELLTAACGIAAAVSIAAAGHLDPAAVDPTLTTLVLPRLPWPALLGLAAATLPALVAPPSPSPMHPARAPRPARSRPA